MTDAALGGDALEVLERVFGHVGFRPGQAEAVEAAVSGRDAVVLLPTGSGKSLCYQVPALVASEAGRGTTIVVSPLIALMRDQVGALDGRGVRAAALHSHQDAGEQREAVGRFLRGELALLYVSPERAAKESFRRMLGRTRIALIAVDEAHCVSQWGHDFRPDYMRLHELRESVDAPMLALTATATDIVLDEIQGRLTLRKPVVVRAGFDRPNLAFSVRHLRAQAERLEVLRSELEEAGVRPRRGAGRALVYCSTRKVTERVASELRSTGFAAGHYHAGRTKLARERAQAAFEAGRTRVLVATNAFGMGIDLPDIRLIVHFQAPGSVEAYYQEAGRAGRDGGPARCVLFFGPADLMTQRRLGSSVAASAFLARRREEAIVAMERYAKGNACRQAALICHFVPDAQTSDCGRCDICRDEVAPREVRAASPPAAALETLPDASLDTILRAVDRLTRPVGKQNLARALRGSKAKTLARGGLLQMPEYAALADHSEAEIVAAIEGLLADGRLRRTGQKYPTVWLPGKPIRSAANEDGAGRAKPPARSSRYGGPVARALDNYRRRQARRLKWKSYMVFQRKVMLAIDRTEPDSHAALARIPGLGPAKIERFGDDILELVRKHGKSAKPARSEP
jgi:ATP-dependent DNA helicase RecQ